MGPVLNTYFSFIISEITDNGPTSVDSAAITLISTLMKEQVIDSVGDFVYDSVYGNQNIISPDGISVGVDVNGINCTKAPDPYVPPSTSCVIYDPKGNKLGDACKRGDWSFSEWYGQGQIYPHPYISVQSEDGCNGTKAGQIFGCSRDPLPDPNTGNYEWWPNAPHGFYNTFDSSNTGVAYFQCVNPC
jgi:hypothetical protein